MSKELSMRKFSSYGPVDTDLYYYAPRKELIKKGFNQLLGENPQKGGHYITVWGPRQCGKTWVMREIIGNIKKTGQYETGILTLERAREVKDEEVVLKILVEKLQDAFEIPLPMIKDLNELPLLFSKQYFKKPVILVLDEFDSLEEVFINRFAGIFREMYISRANEVDKTSGEKACLLHAMALVGVRSVLGIENESGSPFNVQRSMNIPNLTREEVETMFKWYEKDSGQKVEPTVISELYEETRGQPGLTCWLGELLTAGFDDHVNDQSKPLTIKDFNAVYTAATVALPNNNILNLISKAKKEKNKTFLLEMFQTGDKLSFTFDDPTINDLYMNGIVDKELAGDGNYYLRFSCPLVQKRIFNYFANTYFRQKGQLMPPFTKLADVITDTDITIPKLLELYQNYLTKNKDWLFKPVPRRADMRVFEAVYHFNLYAYLSSFLTNQGGRVIPEFPTGNGKIDLVITYSKNTYGIELKSFTNERDFQKALDKAARYGKQLKLPVIYLVSFVEYIDDENRKQFEVDYMDKNTGVKVSPIFVTTGQ